MKKGNLFLLAYVLFIFVAAFIRIFLNYKLWDSLVFAISISSILFTLEGLSLSIHRELNDSLEIAGNFSKETDDINKKDFETLSEMQKKVDETMEEVLSLDEIRKCLEEFDKENSDFKKVISVKKGISKKLKLVSYIFSFIGFLSLFFIMIFSEYFKISVETQEIISVFTFAIILFTEQIDEWASQKIKEDLISSQDAIQAHLKASEHLLMMKKTSETYYKKKEELNALYEEEQTNAD